MQGAVTEINLKFPERSEAEMLAASTEEKLIKDFKGIEVLSWKILVKDYVAFATMKRNSSTEFIINDIQINIQLKASIFSLEELTW